MLLRTAAGDDPRQDEVVLAGPEELLRLEGTAAAPVAAAVEVDARDDMGNTPLHVAAQSCTRERAKPVEVLLENGAAPLARAPLPGPRPAGAGNPSGSGPRGGAP